MAPSVKLGYWDVRGYAEPIRILLNYCNIPFEDVRYGFGPNPETDPSMEEWLNAKPNLGLDFPQIPYLIVNNGEQKISQSVAVIKYLGRKHGLVATTENEQTLEDMLEGAVTDCRFNLIVSFYYKSYADEAAFQAELKSLIDSFTTALGYFEKWIAHKKWLVSDRLSYVDFMAYEFFDWYRVVIKSDIFAAFPKMTAYMKRFEELPRVKEYLVSDAHAKYSTQTPWTRIGFSVPK